MRQKVPLPVFENIDRLVTLGMRPQGLDRGKMLIGNLYRFARSDLPLSYEIATKLMEYQETRIGIFTGAIVPEFLPRGENDGPLGAVALGTTLADLGHDITYGVDSEIVEVVETMSSNDEHDAKIMELDKGSADWHATESRLFDIAIAVEKTGVNKAGVLHSRSGISRDGTRAKVDGLFQRMFEEGKLTIGIGDGGNELGFGKIRDSAMGILPYGRHCQCPCGEGIVASTITTHLFPAAISNWGAYALTGALAILSSNPSLVHTPEKEAEMLAIAEQHDCRDGATGIAAFTVDGVPGEASVALVQLLKTIGDLALSESVNWE